MQIFSRSHFLHTFYRHFICLLNDYYFYSMQQLDLFSVFEKATPEIKPEKSDAVQKSKSKAVKETKPESVPSDSKSLAKSGSHQDPESDTTITDEILKTVQAESST